MKAPANACRTHDPNQWNAEPKKPGKGTECVELEQLCPHVTSGLGSPWGVDTQSTVVGQNALGRGNTVMSKWFVGGILYSLLPANPLLVDSDSAPNTGRLTKEERL